jgi:NADH-quinone oxidoreductase subunit C
MTHIDKLCDVTKYEKVTTAVEKKFKEAVLETKVEFRELTIRVRRSEILNVLRYLRDDSRFMFKMLMDITAVDYPERELRFDVVYHLLSMHKNMRIRLVVGVADNYAIESSHELFAASNWFERETYDMFGIKFENHPDLRRLLSDYDFDGFPLRKDFPMVGHVEVYYDSDEKCVKKKPVDLPQETRYFDKVSEWEGMDKNMSLAEDENTFNAEEFK